MKTAINTNLRSQSILLSLLLLLFSTSAMAQQSNFSGTWTFQGQESISGNLYANGSPKAVLLKQDAAGFSISPTNSNGESDTTTTETFTGNKPIVIIGKKSGKKRVSTIKWSDDGNSFTETFMIYEPGDSGKAVYRNTDTWTISNGQLVLDRKSENFINGETWESKATYSKQP